MSTIISQEAVEAAAKAWIDHKLKPGNWDLMQSMRAALEAAAPHMMNYPHESGDCVVLGPETFTNQGADVICHKGQNYYLGDSK